MAKYRLDWRCLQGVEGGATAGSRSCRETDVDVEHPDPYKYKRAKGMATQERKPMAHGQLHSSLTDLVACGLRPKKQQRAASSFQEAC
jgi:hypothetical protein